MAWNDDYRMVGVQTVSSNSGPWTYLVSTSGPIKARWHLVKDVWALADEDDGEILARVWEDQGLWVVKVDEDPETRFLSEKQAKARAEDVAGPVDLVQPTRQNSAGIP